MESLLGIIVLVVLALCFHKRDIWWELQHGLGLFLLFIVMLLVGAVIIIGLSFSNV